MQSNHCKCRTTNCKSVRNEITKTSASLLTLVIPLPVKEDQEPKTSSLCWIIHRNQDETALAELFEWKDGKSIFMTSTQHMRNMLSDLHPPLHKSILAWVPEPQRLWSEIWKPYSSDAKENCFLWQILHHVPATNKSRKVNGCLLHFLCDCCRGGRGGGPDPLTLMNLYFFQ